MTTPSVTTTICANQYSEDSKEVELPFVRRVGKGENERLLYWQVKPNGNFLDEYLIGKSYAAQALQFMLVTEFDLLLRKIVEDMPKKKKHTGIEAGFLDTLANFVTLGAREVAEEGKIFFL